MGKLKEKTGHNHKLTDWLKFGIFACVMIAPFFAILSRCLYVACNKNAKDSYYGETINEVIYSEITSFDLNENYAFIVNSTNNTDKNINGYVYFNYDSAELINGDATNVLVNKILQYDNFFLYNSGTTYSIAIPQAQSSYYSLINANFIIALKGLTVRNDNGDIYDNFNLMTYNKYSYLDNAFEYSVQKLNTDPIFSWVKNTGIYTPINAMTTGLGFDEDNNTLALLLAYWSLNTAIYIVFDIVIWTFTKLTHLTNE